MKARTTVAGKRIALARFHMADNPCWIASENDAIRHVCYHHRSYPYNCMSTDRDFFPTYRVGADVCAFADGTSSHDSGIRSDERKFAQSNVMTDVASAANTNVPAADNARLDYRARSYKTARSEFDAFGDDCSGMDDGGASVVRNPERSKALQAHG